jgi:hypothetical protein
MTTLPREELQQFDERMMAVTRMMADALQRMADQFPLCGRDRWDLNYIWRQLEHIETWHNSAVAVVEEFRTKHG